MNAPESIFPQTLLAIPIRLDAFVLDKPEKVVGPLIDFKLLPWGDSTAPFLGETIVGEPFENEIELPQGVHLHWTLPGVLTKAMGLPIVSRSSFVSTFGGVFPDSKGKMVNKGADYWQELISLKIITPLKAVASMARVIPQSERTEKFKIASAGLQKNLLVINQLLAHATFPAVPNTWLINAYYDGAKKPVFSKIIESDALLPTDQIHDADGKLFKDHYTALPTEGPPFQLKRGTKQFEPAQPYSFVGANYPLEEWLAQGPADPSRAYLEYPLTAIGAGDPTFAAFYPNCRSVFGYYDASTTAKKSLKYEVIGWYRQGEQDYFRFFIQDFLSHQSKDEYPYLSLLGALNQEFAWQIPVMVQEKQFSKAIWKQLRAKRWIVKTPTSFAIHVAAIEDQPKNHLDIQFAAQEPDIKTILDKAIEAVLGQSDALRMICYASTTIDLSNTKAAQLAKPAVAIGNTGTEALSAYLATQMVASSENKTKVEEYLESVQLFAQQSNQQLDIGTKFAEARHTKGFQAETGGTIWSIRSISAANTKANVQHQTNTTVIPLELADPLNELNQLQQSFDRLQAKVQSSRQQVFAAWSKYLQVKYFDDGMADYPPTTPDTVRDYLKTVEIPQLTNLLEEQLAKAKTLGSKKENLEQAVLDLQKLQWTDAEDWNGIFQAFVSMIDPFPFPLLRETNATNIITFFNQLIDQADLHQNLTPPSALAPEASVLLQNQQKNWSPAQYMRYNRLLLEALFPQIRKEANFVLQPKVGPRFWTANEPVLLFSGPAVKTSPRFGKPGRPGQKPPLSVQFIDGNGPWQNQRPSEKQLNAIIQQLNANQKKYPSFAFKTQTGPSWHPFMLEWMIDFYGPSKQTQQTYPTHFITNQYPLPSGKPDLSPQSSNTINDNKPQPYMGYSLLSVHANPKLRSTLAIYIKQLLETIPITDTPPLKSFFAANGLTGTVEQNLDTLVQNLRKYKLLAWLAKQPGFTHLTNELNKKSIQFNLNWLSQENNFDTFLSWWLGPKVVPLDKNELANTKFAFDLVVAMVAHQKLDGLPVLSQSLGGLNAAMLMLRQIYQLPVMDPLEEFEELFPFINNTRNAVQNFNRFSPEADYPFNPIRAGEVKLDQLNLVDTFGRKISLQYLPSATNQNPQPKPIVAETLRTSGPFDFTLPPRYVPPTRLNFRWLSANDDLVEMNDHPATSPICGWILPNLLDGSLMVYSQSGEALGYIDATGQWRLFPGHLSPALAEGIENLHLRKMVRWICAQGSSFMGKLKTDIDDALGNIEPENSAQHQGLALLIGRPVALVRVSLSLEVKGNLPHSQAWQYVTEPTEFAFDQVEIPIRIGEDAQFNDGFILAWEENQAANPSECWKAFYQRSGYFTNADQTPPILEKAISDPEPTILSMLIDPRGQVHASTGILPVKAIDIPPSQYVDALQKMEVAFLTSPILTSRDNRKISMPTEPGYNWSWTEKEKQGWRTISALGHIQKKTLQKAFPSRAEKIWTLLLEQNWISKLQGDAAEVTPKDQRKIPEGSKIPNLGKSMEAIEPKIEAILAASHLTPFQDGTSGPAPQEIREGWLILKKNSPEKE